MVSYLVVGLGLAGLSFCEQLEKNGKSFVVISDASEQASLVAGGLYNPVILKRFTLAWKAEEQMGMAVPFYAHLEKKLGITVDHKVPVLRRFASAEEQNNWFEASDRKGLDQFLEPHLVTNKNPHLEAPYGFGKVAHTGRIATQQLLHHYKEYLGAKQAIRSETFDFDQLKMEGDGIRYKDIVARQLVFAEGFGLTRNPFFNYLPLNGTKGELLTIKAPELCEESVIKSKVFCIPLGKGYYRVGATYKWKDKTSLPTEVAKQELLSGLRTFLKCDFEVVDQVAGIRPTVADRRPLVGRHPQYGRLFVLNGFGSRGVLIAPYASKQLYDFIEKGRPMAPEMDIARFKKRYR